MLIEEDWLQDIEDKSNNLLRPATDGWMKDIDSDKAEFEDLDIYSEFEEELENDMISSAEAGFVRGFEESVQKEKGEK